MSLTSPTSRFPFTPFPDGWYAVCFSTELPPGGLRPMRLFGQELVLFRTSSGRAVASSPHCPHMGAHLGHGGRVDGELVVCPFHGFAFDADGTCAHAPGAPAPAVRLRTWPLRETHGLVLVYHDAANATPRWVVPELSTVGWTPLAAHRFSIRTHPQETTENSVDTAHLSALHGFQEVEVSRPLSTDGPYLQIAYRMKRPAKVAGFEVAVCVEFDVHVHGLGHSHVDVRVPALGLRARLLVLPTPVDVDRVDLRIAMAVEESGGQRGLALPLRLFPPRLAARLVRGMFLAWGVEDVSRDLAIWENKKYVEGPALTRADGPIAAYRRWCRQFYPGSGL